MNDSQTINEIKHQDLFNNNHMSSYEENHKGASTCGTFSPRPLSSASASMFLFDPSILLNIKPDLFQFQYDKYERMKGSNSSIDLGDNLVLRPLRRDDYARNYMSLLSQLTEVGQVTGEIYERRFDMMRSTPNTYYIVVVEDMIKSKIVATLTLIYEQKFIRGASARGRVEDLVVDTEYRGKKLSKLLLDAICQLAKVLGCYKISLECKDHLKRHYEQFGFISEPGQNHLCRRFV